jgi:hypothetical protein
LLLSQWKQKEREHNPKGGHPAYIQAKVKCKLVMPSVPEVIAVPQEEQPYLSATPAVPEQEMPLSSHRPSPPLEYADDYEQQNANGTDNILANDFDDTPALDQQTHLELEKLHQDNRDVCISWFIYICIYACVCFALLQLLTYSSPTLPLL